MKKAIYFNQEYNPKNPINGVTCLTFDEENGIQVIDNKIKFSNKNYCTAFEVTPNKVEIEAGSVVDGLFYEATETNAQPEPYKYKVKVPACTIHKFHLRSLIAKANKCDVAIDWGDGSMDYIRNGKFKYDESQKAYEVYHDYSKSMKNDVETFTIKIFGKDYFTFRNNKFKDNNLISRIFDYDLPVADHVCNFASMCYGAARLIKVNIPHSAKFITTGFNFSSTFQLCSNLISATGFEDAPFRSDAIINNLFNQCGALEFTDFVIPTCVTTFSGVLYNCKSLKKDINEIIPSFGFALNNISINNAFNGAVELTCEDPVKLAEKLWNSGKTFDFKDGSKPFKGNTFAANVLKSWGGSLTETE
jgi:hypothetical protein